MLQKHAMRFILFLCMILGPNTAANTAAAHSLTSAPEICLIIQQSEEKKSKSFSGNVSWYGPGFQGKKTASGEIFDMNKLTAAHLTLPLGIRVLVEDPRTGKSVIVKVNDRGPYVHTRIMDLSKEGGRRLNLLTRGVAYVNCLIIN